MKFKQNIELLAHNQIILKTHINQLEQVIQSTQLEYIETHNYLLLQTLISQFITTFQIIYDILERLEIAITFSKLNTFHNSIIEPTDLLSEILTITENLNGNKLPFEPILENILLFEKTIEIKSYNKENQLVFIIEVPIVKAESYNYYHLYSLPIPAINSFKTIIPHSKFLLLNEQIYAFSDTQCQEVMPEEFLCQETNTVKIQDNVPCEVQLLRYLKNATNCQYVPVSLTNTKIQKIGENKWIVITPESVVAQQKCGNNKDNLPLNGSYVIELNNQCEVQVQDVIIKTFQNLKPKFKHIKLPSIQTPKNFTKNSDFYSKPLEIETINLDDIKKVYSVLNDQKIKMDTIDEPPIHFHKTSFYTILLYILLTVIIICMLYRQYFRNKVPQLRRNPMEEPQVHGPNNLSLSNSGTTP